MGEEVEKEPSSARSSEIFETSGSENNSSDNVTIQCPPRPGLELNFKSTSKYTPQPNSRSESPLANGGVSSHSSRTSSRNSSSNQNSRQSRILLQNSITKLDNSSLYHSRSRHANFWKDDTRIVKSSSDFSIAQKAGNSRYFLKHTPSNRHVAQMEQPYYYFYSEANSASNSNTPSKSSTPIPTAVQQVKDIPLPVSIENKTSISSSDVSIREIKELERMELLEPKNFDTTEWILTDEEYNNIDNEFPAPPKAFNKNSDYFNPKVYYNNFNLGQFVAVIAVLSVIVFGSLGFLINTAQHYYKTPPPQVYEILSNYKYPTLSAIRTSLIDPDTPKEFLTKKGIRDSAEIWSLVFSDEFNAEGRTFHEGDDQFFTAVDLHYQGTNDLEYYVPHMAETRNGSLHITIDAFQTNGVDYISAMLQSWNKLCFNKNALVEVSLKMPSFSQSRGLWPAVWSLGNLARPGYMATTDGVWPYTYNECDFGITPNQSSPDGISFLPGQRLSKCTCYGQDHPSIGLGRGAPEIDIIEGTHALYDEWALGAQTLQVAPFDPWWRPDYDFLTIENTNITAMKADTGTPQQEAIASTTVLNPNWFGSVRNNSDHNQRFKNNTLFQSYGFEFRSDKTDDRDSYIQFFLADNKTMAIYGDSLHPTENVGWRQISREPMSLIFNLGLSPTWAQIDYGSLEFPATLEIDYIRIYQLSGEEEMTCDPVDYPTFDYINSHANAYMNVNLTSWKEAGYSFPHNSFMNGCQAPTG